MIEVRLFAAARDAAGGDATVTVDAADVPTLRTALGSRYGDRMAQVLALSSLVVDGVRLDTTATIEPGSTVDVLPPFAGG